MQPFHLEANRIGKVGEPPTDSNLCLSTSFMKKLLLWLTNKSSILLLFKAPVERNCGHGFQSRSLPCPNYGQQREKGTLVESETLVLQALLSELTASHELPGISHGPAPVCLSALKPGGNDNRLFQHSPLPMGESMQKGYFWKGPGQHSPSGPPSTSAFGKRGHHSQPAFSATCRSCSSEGP